MRSTFLSIAAVALAIVFSGCDSTDAAPIQQNTVVDVAIDANFSTLVTAVQSGGLETTLRGTGPFTVFAPTNEAFEALPEGALASLLLEENQQQLADILTFHVVPGEVSLSDVLTTTTATTLNGADLPIGLSIEGAAVTMADIGADNGIVHVIDTVIMP